MPRDLTATLCRDLTATLWTYWLSNEEFSAHLIIICSFFLSRGGHIFWHVFHRSRRISYCLHSGHWLVPACCSSLIERSRTESPVWSWWRSLSYLSPGSRYWRAPGEFRVGLLGVLQKPCLEHSVKFKSYLPLDCKG